MRRLQRIQCRTSMYPLNRGSNAETLLPLLPLVLIVEGTVLLVLVSILNRVIQCEDVFFLHGVVESQESNGRGGDLRQWNSIEKTKISGGKGITHLTRPRVEGMARHAILHLDGADLSPEILVDITDDVLTHVVRQEVVRLIMDRHTCHRDTPFPLLTVYKS